jgi:DNA end-binding protein Ku
LIENKSSALNLAGFEDRYKVAVLDLIKAKVAGSEPVLVQRSEVGQAINLMEALRKSMEQNGKKSDAAVRKNGHKRVVLAA